MRNPRFTHLAAALLITSLAGLTLAGPPTICHPVAIGDAKSLPMGSGSMDLSRSYKAENVVKDTINILKTTDSTLVRMETLRRATLYLQKDKARAHELLGNLAFMALDAEASGKTQWAAQAWFDAGYLGACYQQIDIDIDWNPGVADGVHGYAWIQKGITLAGGNAEMEYGAALATLPEARAKARDIKPTDRDQYNAHIRRAALGAQKGSSLEVNLAAHLKNWGTSLDKVRAQAEKAADIASKK